MEGTAQPGAYSAEQLRSPESTTSISKPVLSTANTASEPDAVLENDSTRSNIPAPRHRFSEVAECREWLASLPKHFLSQCGPVQRVNDAMSLIAMPSSRQQRKAVKKL